MIIDSIHVEGFKQLHDVTIHPNKLTCLIGSSCSGKSTFLNLLFAMKLFLIPSCLTVKEPYDRNKFFHGESFELTVRFMPKNIKNSTYEWKIKVENGILSKESLVFIGIKHGCTPLLIQDIYSGECSLLGQSLNIANNMSALSYVPLLKGVKEKSPFYVRLAKIYALIEGIVFFHGGTPNDAVKAERYILGRHDENEYQRIVSSLQGFFPCFLGFKTVTKGTISDVIVEEDAGKAGVIKYSLKDAGEEFLYITSLLIDEKKSSFFIADGIGNVCSPLICEALAEYLLSSDRQMIITSNSPLFLNYLPVENNEKSVFLLRKDNGITSAVDFLSLPNSVKKSDLLGIGELYADMTAEEL